MAETIEIILLGVSGLGALLVTAMALLSGKPKISYEDYLQFDLSVLRELQYLVPETSSPGSTALGLSHIWIANLYSEVKRRSEVWSTPHLSIQDGGDIVFEWWKGKKSLTVYVSADEVWFLQSAGACSDQTDGDANTLEARRSIWQWLTD